ncbi:response regulator transcription factor, partial [Frigoribacterium sp. CFBP 13605]
MKILIADDDPQILRALKVTLGARGYDVVTAADGREALDLAASRHPDLVMLDLGMPHLDGVEVITGLRGWSTVPILVVSGRTDAADKVEALDAGADDYVTKPFSMDELLARIRAQTRRLPSGTDDEQPVVTFGDVQVDLAAKTVVRRPGGSTGGGPGAGGAAGAGGGAGAG